MGIVPLKVSWDPRFRLLNHRDVLGSLMGLGIDRSKFGDIIMGQGGAQILVDSTVADFCSTEFTKIAMVAGICSSDGVRRNCTKRRKDKRSAYYRCIT